jgi:PAS domain S-box-containing protein
MSQIFRSVEWFKRQWQPFTKPSSNLKTLHDFYRAQMLAALMLVALAYIPGYMLFRRLIGDPENPQDTVISIICFVVMAMVYVLSRTERYRLGVFIIVVPLTALTIGQGILRAPENPMNMVTALLWVIPIAFFSSIMLPVRQTIVVIAGGAIFITLVFTINPNLPLAEKHFPFDYMFVFNVLFVVSGYLVGRYTRHIESQSRALVESEERYRSLFESSFVGIVVHENGTIVEANTGFLKSLGYPPSEVIGKPIFQFFVPEEPSDGESILDTTRFEMMARRRDGVQFHIEIYRKNVMYRGKAAQVLAFHDISEHRKSEDSRVKLLAERERSRVLRQFIGDVSHDVRNPLATINTSLYLLRKTVGGDAGPTRYMDTIQAQVVHLNAVLDSLLLMARLDDPESYFEIIQLDLNEAVQQVVNTNQSAADKKQHHLKFEPEMELLSVQGDADEIKRAIKLLVDNALQYTPDGGTITVRTKRLGQVAIIEVEDNGSGISPQDLPHIFQRFYRGDKARGQSDGGGVGLGLPIARKIAETLGGHMDVESQVGVGSTFRIYLPIVIQFAPQVEAPG